MQQNAPKSKNEWYVKNAARVNSRARELYALNKEKKRIYATQNKEHIRAKVKQRLASIPKEVLAQQRREYYLKNKDKILAKNEAYRLSNFAKISKVKKGRMREYVKAKRSSDLSFRISGNCRGRVNSVLKATCGSKKASTTMNLTGCTIEELRAHLESRFADGMNWENYGRNGWHIDHIKPCSSFDMLQESVQKKCFHFTNLQPLWWRDNLRKSDKV